MSEKFMSWAKQCHVSLVRKKKKSETTHKIGITTNKYLFMVGEVACLAWL